MNILLQEGDRLVVSARTTYSSGVAAQESYKVRCPHSAASKTCMDCPLDPELRTSSLPGTSTDPYSSPQ